MEYCSFLLFILLIKSSAAHIDVQTKPPVLILRCRRPEHINMIWCSPSVQSQQHPMRGLAPLARERLAKAREDLSVGILMKLFSKYVLTRCSHMDLGTSGNVTAVSYLYIILFICSLRHLSAHDLCVFSLLFVEKRTMSIQHFPSEWATTPWWKQTSLESFQFFHNDISVLFCFFALMVSHPLLRLTA